MKLLFCIFVIGVLSRLSVCAEAAVASIDQLSDVAPLRVEFVSAVIRHPHDPQRRQFSATYIFTNQTETAWSLLTSEGSVSQCFEHDMFKVWSSRGVAYLRCGGVPRATSNQITGVLTLRQPHFTVPERERKVVEFFGSPFDSPNQKIAMSNQVGRTFPVEQFLLTNEYFIVRCSFHMCSDWTKKYPEFSIVTNWMRCAERAVYLSQASPTSDVFIMAAPYAGVTNRPLVPDVSIHYATMSDERERLEAEIRPGDVWLYRE